MLKYFEFSAEVKHALENKKPVLALESTLITHGFPHPHNLEIAQASEEIARAHNVIPATIAIMNGKIKIGLTADELKNLAENRKCFKASKRDIPYVINKQLSAGTTVAATMFCAHAAGIRVFATGGIGGVHHGDAHDVSADLIELSCTPVAVVCAGAKSILDLPRTLEFLETYSIPVIGYGCDTLPAFYTAATSHKLNCRIDDVNSLSNLLKIHWQLDMTSGILITNPINPRDEIPAAIIEPVIASALKNAAEKQITGKDVTPFLLNEIVSVTQGKSMAANISLIKNNVKLGAELAASL